MKWGVILGVLVVAIIFAVWRSRETDKESGNSNIENNNDLNNANDQSTAFVAGSGADNPIGKILKELKEDFVLLNKIRVKGWGKHSALIDHLLITKQGITVFRDVETPAKSVEATSKEWILETDSGKKKIKNPVNMNNYAISILRNVLKKKLKHIYPKLDFTSVVLFNDSVKVNSTVKENQNAIVIKKSFLRDLLETIAQKPAKLTKSEMIEIKKSLE